jgi:tight adherence protein B
MLNIIAITFVAIFVVTLLVLVALNARTSRDLQQTKVRLEDIKGASPAALIPEVVDILREDVLSDIPWLNDLLQRFNVFPAMRKTLSQAEVEWTLSAIIFSAIFLWLAAGMVVYARTRNGFISLGIGAVAACVPWLIVLHKRSKRFAAFEERLPETLDLMVSAIRAGHGFASAINLAARENPEPIAGEFRKCSDEMSFGLDLRIAMNNLADRVPIPDVQLLVSAVLIQKESGGNLAEILEKTAYVIRERFRLKRQIRVHTAQGRLTGWILAFAPVIFGFLLYLLDPERMSILWKRPLGIKLLWTALVMDVIGALIIRKIVRPRI